MAVTEAKVTFPLTIDSKTIVEELRPLLVPFLKTLNDEVRCEEWLTIEEACSYLKLSEPTLAKYTKEGRLAKHQLPGTTLIRYRRVELDQALKRVGFKVA